MSLFRIGLLSLFLFPSAATAQDDFAKRLKADAAEANILTVAPSGDLLFFGGAITVPALRPSVERCGVWISTPTAERPAKRAKIRAEVAAEAQRNRYSPRERHTLLSRKLRPFRQCEAKMRKRCKQALANVPLKIRKGAVDSARKTVDQLANPDRKRNVQIYLETVLAQCDLAGEKKETKQEEPKKEETKKEEPKKTK